MEHKSNQPELKNWRMQVWIMLPSLLPMENGKFPKKFNTIDIFPEMILVDGKKSPKIRLRKNANKQSNYILEANVKAKEPVDAFESLADKFETVLDMLIFQLQTQIPVTYVEIIDFSEPLKVGLDRELICANSFPSIKKNSVFKFMAKWKTSINPHLIQSDLPSRTQAGLRWFSKAISSGPAVDQFTSMWIALEILTYPEKPRDAEVRTFFKCTKCKYEIASCPSCKQSTKHYPNTKKRIESFIINELGLDKNTFEKLWKTRMMFHGQNKLNSEEIKGIANMTWELRKIVICALKKKLGLEPEDDPSVVELNASIMDTFILHGHRELNEQDINIISNDGDRNRY
jgi:hypothetical protein